MCLSRAFLPLLGLFVRYLCTCTQARQLFAARAEAGLEDSCSLDMGRSGSNAAADVTAEMELYMWLTHELKVCKIPITPCVWS